MGMMGTVASGAVSYDTNTNTSIAGLPPSIV